MNHDLTRMAPRFALTACAVAALAASGVAKADAYAESILNINNFRYIYDSAAISTFNVSPTLRVGSRWQGVSAVGTTPLTSGVQSAAGPDAGTFVPSAPSGFTGFTMPGNFAGGSATLSGSGLAAQPVANATASSQVSVTPSGGTPAATNDSNGEIEISADYRIVAAQASDFSVQFDAYQFLRAYLDTGGAPFLNGRAQATSFWQLTITCAEDIASLCSNGDQVFNWNPRNSAEGGAEGTAYVTGTGSAAFRMSDSTSILSPNNRVIENGKTTAGSFFATARLLAGKYDLSISHKTNAEARIQVPEPATLALVGIGILGAGLAGRSRARKMQGSLG